MSHLGLLASELLGSACFCSLTLELDVSCPTFRGYQRIGVSECFHAECSCPLNQPHYSCGSSCDFLVGALWDTPAGIHRTEMVHSELPFQEQPEEQKRTQEEKLGRVLNED